ncbi:uncharacterized protein LOC111880939 [Lactuca sativa]|uniref:Uncharacterized protein n=1 Tax=Lactuca sativa TaxID=4236 RepID=A0A9R1X747_LACSA|nr:uncharacterized protein LOC111880939 [Lactuca sativa]XP_023733120.1 uncharacterized protein LOC111880939 [Lactuca sativa]KAJ0200119.1 hypothetical protein LSAT_V11C600333770 [Lactuca sativa]
MATVPTKNQQRLHNFSLPFLKWGQRTQINNNCRRRYRNFPLTDSDLNNDRKPHRFHNRESKDTKTKEEEENGGVLLDRGDNTGKSSDVAAAADGDVKPWNLRPRRFVINTADGNGAVMGVNSAKSGWLLRGGASAAAADEEKIKEKEKEKEEDQMKKKRRLWISLSKEEIEEDVYAFTGSKPARRPKKRNKTAQKQVDNVFPGLYLVGISADSYRV